MNRKIFIVDCIPHRNVNTMEFMRLLFRAKICVLLLSWLFVSGLVGAENSDVPDFTKITICGYQLGTVISDQTLESEYCPDGEKFKVFYAPTEFIKYNGGSFHFNPSPLALFKKKLREKKRTTSIHEIELFNNVTLFCTRKEHKIIAIRVESHSPMEDLHPTVINVLSRKYNIKKWNNRNNKYFDFLKNNEYITDIDRSKRKRAFYFDGKTLVYLSTVYTPTPFGSICRSNNYIFFIDVKALESRIKSINEERDREIKEHRQRYLDKQRKEEQERKREIQEAEKRL